MPSVKALLRHHQDSFLRFISKTGGWGLFYDLAIKPRIKEAAHIIVTPFSPFILSESYLSSEIDDRQLGFLNPDSVNLRTSSGQLRHQTVFVQVDELQEFAHLHLSRFTAPFTLITGKWHLPGLAAGRHLDTIMQSDRVTSWYSQNQTLTDYPIRPFPYGVDLWSAPAVLRIQKSAETERELLYVPYARIHKHLSGKSRTIRLALQQIMDRELPLAQYLKKIRQHSFVACPPGDRPDTYRHWEALALGAIPICEKSFFYSELFGDQILSIPKMDGDLSMFIEKSKHSKATDPIWKLEHWKKILAK